MADRLLPSHPVVLVVEDHVILRRTITEYLRLSGYVTVEADSMADAVRVLASEGPVDGVFSDVRLNGPMDGMRLAHWIGKNRPDLPIMLMSGDYDSTDIVERVWDGIFLAKPFRQADAERCIRDLLIEKLH